jgi:hypothetical protein
MHYMYCYYSAATAHWQRGVRTVRSVLADANVVTAVAVCCNVRDMTVRSLMTVKPVELTLAAGCYSTRIRSSGNAVRKPSLQRMTPAQ